MTRSPVGSSPIPRGAIDCCARCSSARSLTACGPASWTRWAPAIVSAGSASRCRQAPSHPHGSASATMLPTLALAAATYPSALRRARRVLAADAEAHVERAHWYAQAIAVERVDAAAGLGPLCSRASSSGQTGTTHLPFRHVKPVQPGLVPALRLRRPERDPRVARRASLLADGTAARTVTTRGLSWPRGLQASCALAQRCATGRGSPSAATLPLAALGPLGEVRAQTHAPTTIGRRTGECKSEYPSSPRSWRGAGA